MRIFWDYKRSFLGIWSHNKGTSLIPFMTKQVIVPPAVLFGTIITTQYILTSSTYYDEYNGDASEYKKW